MSVTSIKRSPSVSPPDLETRVANRKQELISEILEYKKNPSRAGSADAIDKIKAHLTELAQIVKEGGSSAKLRLEQWIAS